MLYPIVIIGSILFFLYAMFAFRKIYIHTKGFKIQKFWVVLSTLVLFFIFGYLAISIIIIFKIDTLFFNLGIATTFTFFFGAIFVAITAQLFSITVINMERIIKERTKKLEETYNKSMKHQKELQRMKDQFIFVAAHELRAPVNAINWSMELLREDYNCLKIPKNCLELVDTIDANGVRLNHLVDDLLDTSRIEYGTLKINKSEFRIDDLINSTIKQLSLQAKRQNITIDYKPCKKNCIINNDPKHLQDVLVNLIANAINYNKPGGKITVETVCKGKMMQFNVRDTGVGLSNEDMGKLFQKFSRIQRPDTQDVTGTGLGLYIVKRVVEMMGGEVWAESEGRGKGSRFSFTIAVK
ncbi:MAG: HAMP domain-containing sensor histidine kinase [bacterium]